MAPYNESEHDQILPNVCEDMKAEGIEIYVLWMNKNNNAKVAAKPILRRCPKRGRCRYRLFRNRPPHFRAAAGELGVEHIGWTGPAATKIDAATVRRRPYAQYNEPTPFRRVEEWHTL
jgi:hypothetical protein